MSDLLALSTPATLALIAGVVIALAFVAGLIVLTIRNRAPQGPDIPPGMRPGPADEVLERRHIERNMAWGVLFVAVVAIWLPVLWLREPDQNVADAVELITRSTERGARWFEEAGEENPTGFGCARCHGEEAQGGSVPFTTETGEFIPAYPVPPLLDVCGGPTTGHPQIQEFEDITQTIMEGREGTPMPSWSVRFEGPMNDQQIQDLVNYITALNRENVPFEDNLCTNASAGEEEGEPAPGPSVTPGVPQEEGGGGGGGGASPEASPEES
ncbi:MAG: c-type cytochrome [Actinomycetota bacterium]